MLKKINSRTSQNVELFQAITDEQAAFINGGNENILIPNMENLSLNQPILEQINSLPPDVLPPLVNQILITVDSLLMTN
jgi:hypothetical protein